jgi:hypothetical protein
MSRIFPLNPTTGQLVNVGTNTFVWNGQRWARQAKPTLEYAATAPVSPVEGTVWFNTQTNSLKVFDGEAFVPTTNTAEVVADIVGQAPETLDTLEELAAALGNDPNFATTVTQLIGGKANASHTHAISEVTNLQSGLDGKANLSGATFTGNVVSNSTFSTPTELQVTGLSGSGQLRLIAGNFGTIVRNDGNDTYLLITNSGDQFGGWNTLRPFAFNNATGLVTVANGLNVSGGSISRNVRQSVTNRTANFSTTSAMAGTVQRFTSTSSLTVTINNVFSIGDRIDILRDNTGEVTIAQGTGVTLVSPGTKRRLNERYSAATVICVASGIYHVIGDLKV